MFLLLAKAIDEYASLKSKAAESNNEALVDPRLEAIVERMLDKYVDLYLFPSILCILLFVLPLLFLGVLWMEDTNKLWEWQLNAEDWINLRKQSLGVIMFMELCHIALTSLIPLLIVENIAMRLGDNLVCSPKIYNQRSNHCCQAMCS